MNDAAEAKAMASLTPTQRLAWCAIHVVRTKILTFLDERGEGSPVEMSRSPSFRGWELGTIAYHCRKLMEYGVIEVKREIGRRGAKEHVYVNVDRPVIDNEEWAEIHPIMRHSFTYEFADRLLSDLAEAIGADTIDSREDRHLTRTTPLLDQRGWKAFTALFEKTYYKGEQLIAEAHERMQETGEKGIRVSIAQLCFELPDLK